MNVEVVEHQMVGFGLPGLQAPFAGDARELGRGAVGCREG